MSPRDRLVAALVADLEHDHAAYERLRCCVDSLHAHLAARDGEAVAELNDEISVLTEAAAGRAARRSRILEALSCSPDGEGMRALIDSLDPSRRQTMAHLWQGIAALARECREQNERNGRLLAMQHDILRQLLGAGPSGALYAPGVP